MNDISRIRSTRAEIRLDRLGHNLRAVRAAIGDAAVYAVAKADAYGHGLVPVAERLQREGVEGFCVALVEEGIALRQAGIRQPILVLNGVYADAHAEVLAYDLTPVVYDVDDARRFSKAANGRDRCRIHLKVDTGMTRLGVKAEEAEHLVRVVLSLGNVEIEGLMTHLSSAEDDPDSVSAQLARLDEVRARMELLGVRPTLVHAANSAGALLRPQSRLDAVRTGLALYGYGPTSEDFGLRPVMKVVTSIVRVVQIEKGVSVGYQRTWKADRPSRIAVVAMGYGDGLMRRLSDGGHMTIAETRCPIVGLISMDLAAIDTTDVPRPVVRGEEVVVFGGDGGADQGADQVAFSAGTAVYEVLTSISPRVPRLHH